MATKENGALTNTTTPSDCQTPSGQIPRDQTEQGIDGYGGKDFEKGKTILIMTVAYTFLVYCHNVIVITLR